MDALEQPTEEQALTISEERASIELEQKKIRNLIRDLQAEADSAVNYPLERLRADVGRWLIPQENTLAGHYALVTEKARDIDFSPANYPSFDAVFTERYEGVGFFEPLNDKFPRYAKLRDSLATVRNFLLETYFPDNSPNDQANIKHLKEIATFLAEGLSNDRVFLGLVPVSNPFKPFIDGTLASQPEGVGARYLYEQILKMQRHSNWTRPFAALTSLFSGTASHWGLSDLKESAVSGLSNEARQKTLGESIVDLADMHDELDRKQARLDELQQLDQAAQDLSSLGDQLLFVYSQIARRVDDLTAPVKREAIDIAHDILNKLKMKLGTRPIEAGMGYNPEDDNAAVGAASSVGRMMQRMIGMMRGMGQDAMLIPEVAGAHQALGQLAYLAKLDALRMAGLSGNTRLAGTLRGQLGQMRSLGAGLGGKSFGDLFDKLDKGVSVLRQRMRTLGLYAGAHHEDEHSLEASTVGSGDASRTQALNQMRQQQMRRQYAKHQDEQRGMNHSQQNAAMHVAQDAQVALMQAQRADNAAYQAQTGNLTSKGFDAPVVNKRAPNGNVARQNANNARKIAFAKVREQQTHMNVLPPKPQQAGQPPHAMKTPDEHPPAKFTIDHSVLQNLGNSLHKAQSLAGSLNTGVVGPQSAQEAVDAAKKSRIRDFNQEYLRDHDPTKGRSR